MINVTATKLRSQLFTLLNRVAGGETVSVKNKGEVVALIVPVNKGNWRDNMRVKPKLLVSEESAFKPVTDIWEDYI